MSQFIVPLSTLPTITPLADAHKQAPAAGQSAAQVPFASLLQSAVENLTATNETAQQSAYNLAVGGSDDLHTGAIDALKYSTAVSFTAGVTSSVIRAYNELMRMSI